MYTKYQDDENSSDHDNKKTDFMVKREPDITNKSYNNNRSAYEEDELDECNGLQNSGNLLKTSHKSFVQIKQEHTDQNSLNVHEGASAYSTSNPDYKTEIEIQLVPHIKEEPYIEVPIKEESHNYEQIEQDLHISVQIKQESADPEINEDLEEWYADHGDKDELAVGLQRSGPAHINTNSNQIFMRSYKTSGYRKRTERKELKHICRICNREYKYKAALENHLEHHPTVSPQAEQKKRNKIQVDESLVCDCGQLFRNKFISNWHKRYHCEAKKHRSNLVTCDLCKKELDVRAFKQHLKRHMTKQAKHSVTQPYYACNFCGKTYYQKSRLDAHEKEHSEGACATKEIICHICDKLFKNSLRLKQHRLFCNEDICNTKPFACEECKKRFPDERAKRRHIRNNHLNNLICDICNKCFGGKNSLRSHIKHSHNANVFR